MFTVHNPFFSSKYCSFMVAGQWLHSCREAEKLKNSAATEMFLNCTVTCV